MALSHSKIVPTAFWVGFLALGFATSLGGPNKHRVEHVAAPAKTSLAADAAVADRARQADSQIIAPRLAQD